MFISDIIAIKLISMNMNLKNANYDLGHIYVIHKLKMK